jgi:hypothetical protein
MISLLTTYKWLARYRSGGRAALVDRHCSSPLEPTNRSRLNALLVLLPEQAFLDKQGPKL